MIERYLSFQDIIVNQNLMYGSPPNWKGNAPLFKHTQNLYDEFQKYEIEIVDGIDFKAAKYFDVRVNNWKLDKLVPSVLEAHKRCKEIRDLDS